MRALLGNAALLHGSEGAGPSGISHNDSKKRSTMPNGSKVFLGKRKSDLIKDWINKDVGKKNKHNKGTP